MLTEPMDLTEQFYFCSMPLRMDTYLGCSFNCQYCFAKGQELIGHLGKAGRGIEPASIEDIAKELLFIEDRSRTSTMGRECLVNRIPIHWGGMSDPFMPSIEKHYKISLRTLEKLSWYKYPTCISTKSPLIAEEPYLSLLKQGNYVVQISIISDDAQFMRNIDYQAPSPKVRMRTLAKLSDAGIPTVGRIQPVIPSTVSEYQLGEFITRLAKTGIYHVSIEGLKLNSKSPIVQLIPGLYKHFDQRQGFESYMSPARKYRYVKEALEACRQNNITCGVADNELRDLGTDNCCLGDIGWKRWDAQMGTAYKIAREKGSCSLDDLLSNCWQPKSLFHLQDYEWCKDESGTRKSQTIQACLSHVWDTRDQAKGPEHLVCMKPVPGKELIYQYRDPIEQMERSAHEQLQMF